MLYCTSTALGLTVTRRRRSAAPCAFPFSRERSQRDNSLLAVFLAVGRLPKGVKVVPARCVTGAGLCIIFFGRTGRRGRGKRVGWSGGKTKEEGVLSVYNQPDRPNDI
jgi:hypothetical protein